MKLSRRVVIAAMSLAFLGAGSTGVAMASESPSGSDSTSQVGAESPGDQAKQDEACDAAGISSSATNINYDDETGVCQLDNGADDGGND